MKNFLVMLGSLLLMAACKFSGSSRVAAFIPGTYIRCSKHEFGKEYDTLAIVLQNEGAKQYRITRRWRYERVLDGQKMEPEYRISITTALLGGQRQLLTETDTGESYTFDPGKNLLYAGSNAYQKIK